MIKEKFTNSKSIRKSIIIDEIFKQNGIKYLLKTIKKDEIINKDIAINNKTGIINKDPFAPPIEEDILIDEDFTDHHRLCFNKFPVVDYHLILPTKQDLNQYTHLSENGFFLILILDFSSLILLIRIVDGYGFFNGGFNAGASQPHKHLQVLPFEHNKEYGIFLLMKNEENLEKLNLEYLKSVGFLFYKIKIFEFNHVFIRFSDDIKAKFRDGNRENRDELGKIIFEVFDFGLIILELKKDPLKITTDYSMLISDEFMIIIPRKNTIVELKNGNLNLNSACFTLGLLVKNNELKNELKSMKIKDIFKSL